MEHKKNADGILKEFWRSNERFADLFNVVVFGGDKILSPDMLEEMDTEMTNSFVKNTRDLIKKCAYGIEFVLVGLENQQKIHYAMPLRTMMYDALSYYREYQDVVNHYKNGKIQGTSDEFLSKMKKEDRLHPVITLIIYYGETPWDGPFCLKDMMVEMPEKIQAKFSNYQMNLVQVRDGGDYSFQNEDVKTIMEFSSLFLQGRKQEIVTKKIRCELAAVLGTMVGWKYVKQFVEKQREEEIDMCTMVDEIEQKGKILGQAEGKILEKVELTRENLSKSMQVDVIAEFLGVELSYVESIHKMILEIPDITDSEIAEKLLQIKSN